MYNHDTIKKELDDLQKGLAILGLKCTTHIIQTFQKYVATLYSYRSKLHLLSQRDYRRIARRHFLVSLMTLPYVGDCRIACDLGAGAGFPSVPLKILRPEIRFTLFESKKKKAEFLSCLINELNLTDITVVNDRAEHYCVQKFDLVLVRAAGKIKKLINVIERLMAPKGSTIFYKSQQVEDELSIARSALQKRKFKVRVERKWTPVENLPLALVILKKS